MTELIILVGLFLAVFVGIGGLVALALLRGYSIESQYKVGWLLDTKLNLRPPRRRSRAPPKKLLPSSTALSAKKASKTAKSSGRG